MFNSEINLKKNDYTPPKDIDEKIELISQKDRNIYIGSITPQLAIKINKTIRVWNDFDKECSIGTSARNPIKLYIDSVGGDFDAMLSIMGTISASVTPIYTINIGVCEKEALYIFLTGSKRYSYTFSSFGLLKDLKMLLDDSPYSPYKTFYEEVHLKNLKDLVLEKTKLTEQDFDRTLKTIKYFTPEEALKVKITNNIASYYGFE